MLIGPITLTLIIIPFLLLPTIQQQEGTQKAAQLRNLVLHSTNPLIQFDGPTFQYFVQQQPRPYDLVIFFTTKDCDLCDQVQKEFIAVQQLYKRSGALYPDNQLKHKSVFFGIINFQSNTASIFKDRGFKSAPNIVYYSHKLNTFNKHKQKVIITDHYQWTISRNDGYTTSQKILNYVNSKSGRTVVYKEPIINLLILMTIIGCLLITTIKLYQYLQKYLMNPKLWLLGSLLIYWICLSGIVYTMTQNASMTSHDDHGNLIWYQPGRGQLGIEGLVMSSAITIAGIILLFAIEGPRHFHSSICIHYLSFLVSTSLLVFILVFIDRIYQIKQKYKPTFYPPSYFIKGPLINDQGNSF